jgi:hypothetical protein
MSRATEVAAGLVALGLIVAGGLVGRGFTNARLDDRFVSVKGVSEREVKADLALWPIQFSSADEDLARAQARNEAGIRRTLGFLAAQGLDTSSAQLQSPQVTDRQANPYQPRGEGARFIVSQSLILRSTEPDRVLAASQRIGELVASGVVLSSGPEYGGPSGPSFLFTKLNDIKPEMIAEATARAREAAEQFARDARSRLGGIRRASQGVFVILPRDQAPGVSEESQLMKTVRVVTSVDYYLRD